MTTLSRVITIILLISANNEAAAAAAATTTTTTTRNVCESLNTNANNKCEVRITFRCHGNRMKRLIILAADGL
jgi:hypothetical protein